MRVCLGGTFDRLHPGHERLLAKAFEVGDEVFIGVTTDRLAQAHRTRTVRPFEARRRDLERFLARRGWRATVSAIDHPHRRALEPRYDAIVVSPETLQRTQGINAERRRRGLSPLRVFTIPFVYGPDGLRVTATRIAAGDIDERGRRRRALRIAVGTANRVKAAGVRDAFAKGLPRVRTLVRAFDVPSRVPEQPKGAQTLRGARNRALAALRAWPEAEYGVGIEAGLLREPTTRRWLDVQYAVVLDRNERETFAHGGGFYYPDDVTRAVLAGKTVSQVLGPVAGDPRLGSTTGAIGYLTRNALDRRALTAHAVLLALTPRIRPELYDVTS